MCLLVCWDEYEDLILLSASPNVGARTVEGSGVQIFDRRSREFHPLESDTSPPNLRAPLLSVTWKPPEQRTTKDTVVETPYQHGHDDVADTIRRALDSLDWQPLSDTAARASIAQLARSTLFKRRWIIQELFFAKQASLH